MNRWVMMMILAVALIGCDRLRPGPTPTATTNASTSRPLPTLESTVTPLPPTLPPPPTEAPTVTIPTEAATLVLMTETPTATATRIRIPATPRPKASVTNTAVALKYGAPELVEPGSGDTRIDGKDDLLFRWKPVANLAAHECYLVTLQVINLADPLQHYAQDSFVAQDTCNSAISSGIVEFTLRKKNPPSYSGLVTIASNLGGPSNTFKVKWWVTVVLDRGPDPQNSGKELATPLSPPSGQFDFTLQSG